MNNSAPMFRRALVAAAVVLNCAPALAAEVKPPPKDQPAGSVPADPKQVVCKRVDGGTGMLPGAKVCHTRAEWAEIEKQGGDQSDKAAGTGN